MSEEALDEFITEGDLQRQYQFRCQIETIAGDFAAARRWLAQSLGSSADDHEALASCIKTMTGAKQGFALLHWTRIAMEAGRAKEICELKSFVTALESARFESSPWLVSLGLQFPAHGIRRHIAVALTYLQSYLAGMETLGRLMALESAGKAPLMLMQLAGIAEVAASLAAEQPDKSRLLLYGDKRQKGLFTLATEIASTLVSFPRLVEISEKIVATSRQLDEIGPKDPRAVVASCRLVG